MDGRLLRRRQFTGMGVFGICGGVLLADSEAHAQGRLRSVKVENRSGGTDDVVEVQIVKAMDRSVGDKKILAVCVLITSLVRDQRVSFGLGFKYADRSMLRDVPNTKIPGYGRQSFHHFEPGQMDLAMYRIECTEKKEGSLFLSKLSCYVSGVSYTEL